MRVLIEDSFTQDYLPVIFVAKLENVITALMSVLLSAMVELL